MGYNKRKRQAAKSLEQQGKSPHIQGADRYLIEKESNSWLIKHLDGEVVYTVESISQDKWKIDGQDGQSLLHLTLDDNQISIRQDHLQVAKVSLEGSDLQSFYHLDLDGDLLEAESNFWDTGYNVMRDSDDPVMQLAGEASGWKIDIARYEDRMLMLAGAMGIILLG